MGCFSLSKSRRKDRYRLLPASLPQSVIYENKPTALPDPLEVESGVYGRNLSAPPSFNDKSPSQTSTFPRAQYSAPPGFVAGNNEANLKAMAKQANRFTALCSRRVCCAPNQTHHSASWHSSPLVGSCNRILTSSFRHSGSLLTSSSNSDSSIATTTQSCRYAFGGRPMYPPPPQPSGRPLPLPLPQDLSLQFPQVRDVKSASSPSGSTLSCGAICDGHNHSSPENKLLHSKHLPTPEVTKPCALRCFSFEELAARCMKFSPEFCIGESCGTMHRIWIDERSSADTKQKTEVAVVRLQEQCCQDDKEFLADVISLAEARNSHLCALIGYSMESNKLPTDTKAVGRKRLLVYEHLPNGSLDRHLYGQDDSPNLDWFTRMKVALDAARGLMELHNKFLDKALYCDFRSLYIQLDRNFSAKLTGYGLNKNFDSMAETKDLSKMSAYFAPETVEKRELSSRSNLWSFGVVLLELLTGRQHGDETLLAEERDLVKWCTIFLRDPTKLLLVIDPKLEGRYPAKDAKIFGDLALQCLESDPNLRPNIDSVVEVLKSVQWLMPTPVSPIKHEPPECVKSVGSKSKSLKQALHERDPEDDLYTLFSPRDAPSPVKLHRQLQEKMITSLFKPLASSRSSMSCSSSLALERNQNQIVCQVQLSQTG